MRHISGAQVSDRAPDQLPGGRRGHRQSHTRDPEAPRRRRQARGHQGAHPRRPAGAQGRLPLRPHQLAAPGHRPRPNRGRHQRPGAAAAGRQRPQLHGQQQQARTGRHLQVGRHTGLGQAARLAERAGGVLRHDHHPQSARVRGGGQDAGV